MDIETARTVLARITYKPGFRIILSEFYINGDAVLKLSVDDVSKTVQISTANMTDSDLVHRVFAEILSWEQHEACEFFRFENVRIFSPHANVHLLREVLK